MLVSVHGCCMTLTLVHIAPVCGREVPTYHLVGCLQLPPITVYLGLLMPLFKLLRYLVSIACFTGAVAVTYLLVIMNLEINSEILIPMELCIVVATSNRVSEARRGARQMFVAVTTMGVPLMHG